ncbi:response regulator transcription factor [Glycomyces sp. MUSA5-2]|uniref:response regulator transcription factor n=1 Tax=Glycomyces sp. MUSA5-2 TaxID=2053002 RepID=UPI0030092B2C
MRYALNAAVLSPREHDVPSEAARGASNAQIARALGLTETSVKAHISRILAKLGLDNRVQIALLVRDAEA